MAGSCDLEISGGIATLTLRNPGRRNAFDEPLIAALGRALDGVRSNDTVRVLLLQGAEDCFSAGMDLNILAEHGPSGLEPLESGLEAVTESVASLPHPVIAALRGPCMGAGVQLAMAADMRVAADNLHFGIPAAVMGIVYPVSAISRMIAVGGKAATARLLFGGKPLSASLAHALGFVEEVHPVAAFGGAVAELAETMAGYPSDGLQAAKAVLAAVADGELGEAERLRRLINHSDAVGERMQAFARRLSKSRSG
jgi:enoyl-CoA hydratase